ncbi:hypothetical protein [Rossellomorea marisflavi]|uniref:hypothetical protein n=1 Tax=Rossellomorea marisflavi TaxID=189381 RepID=UPI00207986B3|nr:hypothetical protein [Rossellomorea marisflavi]USK90274.1 hypothetical protein LIT29_11815 [Rossellomorea marisflavi]
MAFGINRTELNRWKKQVAQGKIAFLTHYWLDSRFPDANTVTKAGCSDLDALIQWGRGYGLKPEWIDHRHKGYPHFDLLGEKQLQILMAEGLEDHIDRFHIS